MTKHIFAYGATLITFVAIDLVWLMWLAWRTYVAEMEPAERIRTWSRLVAFLSPLCGGTCVLCCFAWHQGWLGDVRPVPARPLG